MTIKEFQRRALNIQGVYLPDVLDILKEIFNVSSVDVIIDGDKELDSRSIEILDRLNKKEPSAYIIGHIQFAGMTIKVNPNVLIPRMETEELVLNLCETIDFSNKKILDLCCGSGCIGLSIAKRFPSSTVILSDISKEAINVAEENKRINDINNATFVVSDFLESIKDKFDYIISNPPYIPEGTKTETSYEPDLALFSGIDGLDSYMTIESVNGGKNYLKNDSAIKQFGLIWAVQKWDDVTVPENLMIKGKEWLRSNQYKTLTLELTAIDMSMLKSDIDSFDLGDTIHVIAKDFGLDAVYPVQKKTTYLQEPEKNTIVLSNTSLSKSYSKKVEGSLQNIEGSIQNLTNSVNSVRQEMPTEKKLLELTTARAESLINIGTHGNVYLVNDGRGYPKELLIMDSQDIGTAKKVWKFADNELKHSITGYNGTYQKVLSDGKVIGECVSGILKDIILENGSLTTPTITDAVIYGGQIHMTGASGNALDVYEGEKGYEINSENINGKNPKGNKTVVLGNTPYGHIELYDESGNVGTMISASMMQTYGVKNRIVKTENYNDRLMYCYESMIPMFSDIGEGAIDETGKCIVYLDDVFIEAVDTECLYQVSLQAYGKGNCWLSKREPNYFVVEGTKDMTFGWEIKAVQRGYVNVRAEQLKREEQQINYASDTMDYLNECLYSEESEVF